jgi:thiol-disulfide isomerase/thioredoxin
MKKFFAVFLAIIMCLTLSACASEEPDDSLPADDQGEDYSYEVDGIQAGKDLGSFESTDLNGNSVTDAVFADADVTVVNVWGTFCGPCIGEMPDLQEMSENLPDNAQVVGFVIDAATGDEEMINTAVEVCDQTGVTYTNILASDSVMEIVGGIAAVPTTFIVDSEGVLVCEPIVGADVEAYKKAVSDYLG